MPKPFDVTGIGARSAEEPKKCRFLGVRLMDWLDFCALQSITSSVRLVLSSLNILRLYSPKNRMNILFDGLIKPVILMSGWIIFRS